MESSQQIFAKFVLKSSTLRAISAQLNIEYIQFHCNWIWENGDTFI